MVSDREVIFRLFLAVLFSGLVGLEREVSGRAAGLRTHILVCTGSALMMLTAIHLFYHFKGATQIDPGRFAAQVITGIGFLGAGTIIQIRDSVRGLTTAAAIWVVAGIGLAVGAGFYVGALTVTAISLAALYLLSQVEKRLVGTKKGRRPTNKEAAHGDGRETVSAPGR